MDSIDLATVEESFLRFHAEFAPVFGSKPCRQRSQDYLRGLLAQAQERGNAENLSEVTTASPRVLQRFLSESTWDDDAVVAKLQTYLGPRLNHPEAVWIVDESGFVKQGTKSVGVARQYCGAVGKIANCQMGVFLAHSGPLGRALVDKRLYVPEVWTRDTERCNDAEIPEQKREYQSTTALALEMLLAAQKRGPLRAGWVTGDDAYGKSPIFRDGVADAGWQYVLEVPGNTPVWPVDTTWETPAYRGRGRRPQAQPVVAERQEARARADALPVTAWQVLMVGDGAQGPRSYRFAFERVRESRDGEPGAELWLIHKRNRDGTEPRTFFSNAPPETPLPTLARVAMSRWPVETEFEEEKSQVALDEYEVRRWPGWHHHVTMCLLASAFLLILQQEWKKKDAADHAAANISRRVRAVISGALGVDRVAPLAGVDPSAQRTGQTVPHPASVLAAPGWRGSAGPLSLEPSL